MLIATYVWGERKNGRRHFIPPVAVCVNRGLAAWTGPGGRHWDLVAATGTWRPPLGPGGRHWGLARRLGSGAPAGPLNGPAVAAVMKPRCGRLGADWPLSRHYHRVCALLVAIVAGREWSGLTGIEQAFAAPPRTAAVRQPA